MTQQDTHARFLDYLESFPYFAKPGDEKLTKDNFAELDEAYQALFATREERRLTQDERKLFRGLARVLLRD